jgi:hypothetical protein
VGILYFCSLDKLYAASYQSPQKSVAAGSDLRFIKLITPPQEQKFQWLTFKDQHCGFDVFEQASLVLSAFYILSLGFFNRHFFVLGMIATKIEDG